MNEQANNLSADEHISISVNGESVQISRNSTVMALLEHRQIEKKLVAVARNGEFVTRSTYHMVTLKQGDALDIVSPVGGG